MVRRHRTTTENDGRPDEASPLGSRLLMLGSRWIAIALLVCGITGCINNAVPVDEARTCSELVDAAVGALVEVRDSADDLTRADFLRSSVESREVMEPYFEAILEIQDRSDALGCRESQLSEEFEQRVSELQVRSVGGAEVLLEAYGSLNPFERP